jgi:ParB family chromosome partitioning protein
MTANRKRQALGRGLSALIPGGENAAEGGELVFAPIDEVFPNPGQPRRRFGKAAMDELTASILEQGVIQPLLARKVAGGYELVAGERRLRAARLAGLDRVPLLVRKVEDAARLEIALVENIQRENLNAIEEAFAYRELLSLTGGTQEKLALKVGKDRATVANALRLLNLPDFVREEVIEGKLSGGHARALLPLKDEKSLREVMARTISKGLSVREVEGIVSRIVKSKQERTIPRKGKPPETEDLEKRLSRKLGCRVRITEGQRGGRLEIRYGSLEALNDIAEKILKG